MPPMRSTGKTVLCRTCHERPAMPSRIRLGRDLICSRCHNRRPGVRAAQQRKWRRYCDSGWDAERQLAANNPRRAAYRAIGLEAFNLVMGRKWNGEAYRKDRTPRVGVS